MRARALLLVCMVCMVCMVEARAILIFGGVVLATAVITRGEGEGAPPNVVVVAITVISGACAALLLPPVSTIAAN